MKDIRIVIGKRRLGQPTVPRSVSSGSSRSLKATQGGTNSATIKLQKELEDEELERKKKE